MPPIVSGREALRRLREGNERYVSNVRSLDSLLSYMHRAELSAGQSPIAIILGCSDSRVPAEVVFDQGLGDLFVIRVAGNIVAPSQVGSVEFAASLFGSRLVAVLGHTGCGAIKATVDELEGQASPESENLRFIVGAVRPAVEPLMTTPLARDHDALMKEAGRANVRATVHHLRHGSPLLEKLISEKGLVVVGAEYDLATGRVEFFDGVPD
jgi:carbonic anhydrase